MKKSYLSKLPDIRVVQNWAVHLLKNHPTVFSQIKLQSKDPEENISEAVQSEDLCVSSSKDATQQVSWLSLITGHKLAGFIQNPDNVWHFPPNGSKERKLAFSDQGKQVEAEQEAMGVER